MSLISLEGAVRTCKVNTAWANRIQSDRFENPNLMLCATWNGLDTAGRPVAPDSYMTKTAGCNSALDRVDVENFQRPQYIEYLGLDAAGINGNIYQGPLRESYQNPGGNGQAAYQRYYGNNMLTQQTEQQQRYIEKFTPAITGTFGGNPSYGTNVTSCGVYNGTYNYPYTVAQRQEANVNRQMQALQRQGNQRAYDVNSGGY